MEEVDQARMGELEIKLPSGGSARVKGTPAEIAEVLRLAGLAPTHVAAPKLGSESRRRRPESDGGLARRFSVKKTGPRAMVEALLAEGFFKSRRTLGDVRDELRRGGHMYKATDLSPAMIRLVRDKQLKRTKAEEGHWAYAER